MFLSSFSPLAAAPTRLPDDEGETVAGYTLGPIIGYGASSIIRRASSTSGGTVAIKVVRRSDLANQSHPSLARKRLDHEASIWLSLSHEHILPLFSAVHTPHADFFVTLYCPAGTLFDILKRDGRPALPQDDAGMMFRQVVRGLRYLHEVAQLVHRDIKLENVLVDEMGVCRIGDFGMSRNIGDLDADDEDQVPQQELEHHHGGHLERRATFVQQKRSAMPGLRSHASLMNHAPRHRNSTTSALAGSPSHAFQPGSLPYAAPEILTPNPVRVDPSQDIWALGIMLYGMLAGRLPFNDSFEPRLQMKILNAHGTIGVYEIPPGIGRSAELVLKGCIDRCLTTRWNIAMVDELAWGVGWGDSEESGVSTPSHEEDVEIL
ncbi:kinase-like protein, partial [Athelia psychrophila]